MRCIEPGVIQLVCIGKLGYLNIVSCIIVSAGAGRIFEFYYSCKVG